jgi:carbonic anhydrase/acetyltransferase-like protein (isoleucine patch superfamily)
MTLYRLNDVSPRIPDSGDYWVAPDANVIGNVVIGDGVGIWFGCTLRGDNDPITIGDGSNVQENTVMHTDDGYPLSIGQNCTIGHKAMLHGCTIGDNSLIGMGATVLNGAKIGRNCLIGAGALVTENKVIPDGSLVMGAPGKVVRELDAKAIAMLTWSAKHYQDNMRRFRDGLVAIEG